MVAIVYKSKGNIDAPALAALYGDAGWIKYTDDREKLVRAVGNSLLTITAWDGDTLAGLVRAVGDGETILYIQDILVLKAYRRQGIGRELLRRLLDSFSGVRQKVLLTDDTEATRGFYEAMGFTACDSGRLVGFVKFD